MEHKITVQCSAVLVSYVVSYVHVVKQFDLKTLLDGLNIKKGKYEE